MNKGNSDCCTTLPWNEIKNTFATFVGDLMMLIVVTLVAQDIQSTHQGVLSKVSTNQFIFLGN